MLRRNMMKIIEYVKGEYQAVLEVLQRIREVLMRYKGVI